MTNKEIIEKYKTENNIPLNKPLLSFLEWNKKGYKVKAGEKAHIKIMLWKKIKKKQQQKTEKKLIFHIM